MSADPRARLREEAERLLQGITPGEWWHGPYYSNDVDSAHGRVATAGHINSPQGIKDAAFIAAAPRLVRELLAVSAPDHVRELIGSALSGLPDSGTAGPDGTGYTGAWEALSRGEQVWVNNLRRYVEDELESVLASQERG